MASTQANGISDMVDSLSAPIQNAISQTKTLSNTLNNINVNNIAVAANILQEFNTSITLSIQPGELLSGQLSELVNISDKASIALGKLALNVKNTAIQFGGQALNNLKSFKNTLLELLDTIRSKLAVVAQFKLSFQAMSNILIDNSLNINIDIDIGTIEIIINRVLSIRQIITGFVIEMTLKIEVLLQKFGQITITMQYINQSLISLNTLLANIQINTSNTSSGFYSILEKVALIIRLVADLFTIFRELKDLINTIGPIIGGLGTRLQGAGGIFGVLRTGISGIGVAIRGVGMAISSIPVIGWILALIAALVGLFTYLWDNSAQFRGIVYGIWNVVQMVFTQIGNIVSIVFSHIWNIISPALTSVFNMFRTVFNTIWLIISTVFGAISSFISNSFGFISRIIGRALGWISSTFGDVFQGVYNTISGWFDRIWDTVSGVINGITDAIQGVSNFFGRLFGSIEEAYDKGEKKGIKNFNAEQTDEGEVDQNSGISDIKGVAETDNEIIPGLPKGSGVSTTKTAVPGIFEAGAGTGGDGAGGFESGGAEGVGSGAGGSSKTININISNYFSLVPDDWREKIEEIADLVVGRINDRLEDSVIFTE